MANTRVHIYVSGRVQGVFFRQSTEHQAQKLGVKGWVRNLPDGKVEAVFEGKEEAVEALVEFCRRGPSYAVVGNVDVTYEAYKGEFTNFQMC